MHSSMNLEMKMVHFDVGIQLFMEKEDLIQLIAIKPIKTNYG